MKCEHCGSTDIIGIQGQNFCLNCGHPVATVAKTEPIPPAVAPKAVAPSPPKLRPKTPPKPRVKVKPKVVASDKPTTKITKSRVVVNRPVVTAPKPARAEHHALRQETNTIRGKPVHPLRFSFFVSLSLSIVAALLIGISLSLKVDTDIVVYAAVGCIVGLTSFNILAQSALMYGVSRSQDGRPVLHSDWWTAAQSGLMDVINVNIVTIIGAGLLIGLDLLLWRVVSANLGMSVIISAPIFGLANLLIAWLLIGIYIARHIAIPAVIVGGVSASKGLKVGWSLYCKAGGHLVAIGLEALLGRGVVLAVLIASLYFAISLFPSTTATGVIVGTTTGLAVVVFAFSFITLEWETRLWLKQYRHWIGLLAPAERVRLLTGRMRLSS